MKQAIIELIDDAVTGGWTVPRVCGLLELDRVRAWRWKQRALTNELSDVKPGGRPIHTILAWEEQAILRLFDEWGPLDRSHRKLAHRGSYLDRVYVSPSTVDRVLARNGLVLAGNPRPARTVRRPWPDWVQWRPNQLWCWDATHFTRCESQIVYGIVDIVSKKWISTLLCPEATSVQVKVVFLNALDSDGILEDLEWRLDRPDDVDLSDTAAPILLAVSDNGPEMRSDSTRTFMALVSIGQHFGRPSTPTDQAWIEMLWGHIKAENPHLLTITDPAILAVELERVRLEYNNVRLHEANRICDPERRTPRPRPSHPPSRNRRPHRRRHRPPPTPPKHAIMTNHQHQPQTPKCGLKKPPSCCKESDTPQSQHAALPSKAPSIRRSEPTPQNGGTT